MNTALVIGVSTAAIASTTVTRMVFVAPHTSEARIEVTEDLDQATPSSSQTPTDPWLDSLPPCPIDPGGYTGSTPPGPWEPGDPACDARGFGVPLPIKKQRPPYMGN